MPGTGYDKHEYVDISMGGLPLVEVCRRLGDTARRPALPRGSRLYAAGLARTVLTRCR